MAYSTPKIWVHGDTTSNAELIKFCNSLDAIHDILGDVQIFFPAAHVLAGVDNDVHYFIHRYRWLYFQSDGDLVDPADPTVNTQSLSEDGEPTLLDLNTVDWLFPGKLYRVETCTWAQESRDA